MTNRLHPTLVGQSLPLEGVWLLLVDDQVDTAEIITWVLEAAGAEVITVYSADEAIRAVECFIPDVLISDIQLPDIDGYVLLQHLREQITTWQLDPSIQLPAIALTGYSTPFADPQSQLRACEAGFQKYLSKPVEIEELVSSVAELSQYSSGRS